MLYAFYVPLVGCNDKQYNLHGTNILKQISSELKADITFTAAEDAAF